MTVPLRAALYLRVSTARQAEHRMIEAGTSKPAPFDIVIVHSFSRFFRDHFELEFARTARERMRIDAAAIAATISARSPSGSKSRIARSASSARKAICLRR
jgi:hypothetical protein